MCIFYIMPLIYTKILLCIDGEALFLLLEFISGGIRNITPFHLNLHKFFSNGKAKEEYRHLLDLVFNHYRCTDLRYQQTFRIPNSDPSVFLYVLREGIGHHVILYIFNIQLKCHLSPGGILLT